jgi:putative redox protein
MSEAHTPPPVLITHEGGLKFAAQVRSHRIVTDQPERAGGEDAGPSPLELLSMSLGSCVALYVQRFCHSRALSYEGMRVEVAQGAAGTPGRVGQFVVRVVLPAELPEHAIEMLERVVRSCPAHNTLHHGASVAVHIDVPASADHQNSEIGTIP